MLTEQQIAEGWVEHDGGPCPLRVTYPIEVMFRDGDVQSAPCAGTFSWRWSCYGPDFADTIAYRVRHD